MAAPMVSRSAASSGSSVVMVASQKIAPSTTPGRLGLRPWSAREAFQTMPQERKATVVSASDSAPPSCVPAIVHSATEAEPTR